MLITSFHPLIARNILFTPLLSKLSAAQVRIFIAVPDFKKEYFVRNFGSFATIVPFPVALSRRTLIFRWLSLALLNSRTLYIKKRSELQRTRRLIPFLFSVSLASTIGRSRLCVRFFRAMDRYLHAHPEAAALFESYKPDLVFATDVQNEADVALMHEGRNRGIKVIGMVRSWDNLSSKGLIRFEPDLLIVHNELIAREAVRYNFVDRGKIVAVGIPHYDRYINPSATNRTEFFAARGFSLERKLILFSPIGNRYIPDNKLDQLVLDTLASLPVNILVRFPPADEVNLVVPKNTSAKIAAERSGVSFWQGGPKLNEIDKTDDDSLIASLSVADLLVVGQSTMVIDAAMFNVPSVVINFDEKEKNYYQSVKRYYDGEYYRLVKESGAVRLADSPDDLIKMTKIYLDDRTLQAEARKKIVRERAHALDAHSTDRLYEALEKAIA